MRAAYWPCAPRYYTKNVMREIARIRAEAGLTQGQLAEMCGVSQATMSRVEAGRDNPSLELLKTIAAALKVHPAALLSVSENESRFMQALMSLRPDQFQAIQVLVESMASPKPPQG